MNRTINEKYVVAQVTETRTGPLGCSNYDNLDSVSSVLVQSPENKVHLQGLYFFLNLHSLLCLKVKPRNVIWCDGSIRLYSTLHHAWGILWMPIESNIKLNIESLINDLTRRFVI